MALAFHPGQFVTAEELAELSRAHPALRFERDARGELIVAPPVGTVGGRGELRLAVQVDAWAQRNARGFAVGPNTGFALPDGSVLAPDAAWVSWERWRELGPRDREGYAHLAPDVAFELLSPGDALDAARVKAHAYLRNGTRLVALLDPRSRSVECHRSDAPPERYAELGCIALEPEMPGFVLDAHAVFAAAGE